MDAERRTIRWEGVEVELLAADVETMRERWRSANELPEPLRSLALAENRGLMNILTAFDASIVPPGTKPEPLSIPGGSLSSLGSLDAYTGENPPEPLAGRETAGERQQDLFSSAARYYGSNPTDPEREAGEDVDRENRGPLRSGSAGHRVLRVYGSGEVMTAYEASLRACGNDESDLKFHGLRRESTRLRDDRGFLADAGRLPNPANPVRKVGAYRITESGLAELRRLG